MTAAVRTVTDRGPALCLRWIDAHHLCTLKPGHRSACVWLDHIPRRDVSASNPMWMPGSAVA
jgi:hypothetical protein